MRNSENVVLKEQFKHLFYQPILANVSILYPLKIQENLWFPSVFREYKMGILAKTVLVEKSRSFLKISNLL